MTRTLWPLVLGVMLSSCTSKVETTCQGPTYRKVDNAQLELEIDSAEVDGRYVNMAIINHTDSDFTIDAIHIDPDGKHGRVRSRIVMSPETAKRVVAALQDNIGKFETKFRPAGAK